MPSRSELPLVVRTKKGQYRINHSVTLSVIPGEFLLRFVMSNLDVCHGRLLDVGCGTRPYRMLYESRVDQSIGIDVPSSIHGMKMVNAVATAGRIPFKDASFDTVVCTNVLEHVPDPEGAFAEIGRVCKPGGALILAVPFLYTLHEQPHDFQRFTVFGLKERLGRVGFEVVRSQAIGGFGTALLFFVFLAVKTLLGLDKLRNPRWYDAGPVRTVFAKWQWLYVKIYHRLFARPSNDLQTLTRSELFGSLGYCVVARKVAP